MVTCPHPYRRFGLAPDGTIVWVCVACGERGAARDWAAFDRQGSDGSVRR